MKYRSKKGTIINIPDGLSAKDIAAIKADADAGYGTRAQKTADSLGKKVKGKTTEVVGTTDPIDEVVNTKTGAVNVPKAVESVAQSEKQDITTNFNLSQPRKITDQFGNSRTVVLDPETGQVTLTDEAGGTAKKFQSLAEAAAETFNGSVSRNKAEEAAYGTLTKYYDRDQAREMEESKQELANRGIPYDPAAAQDPNTKNLYGRTIGGIGEKYRGLKDTASKEAILAGNQAYATDAAARDSFLNAVTTGAQTFGGQFGQYNNTVQTDESQDKKDLIGLSSAAFLQIYGVDKDTYIKNKALNKPTGGGGDKKKDSGGGFEILG